uniref:Uncharacterized protein n=1 Tax=Arundo donax TaxID=35708 RepID=A0A0A9C169_ARUDO
MIKKKCTRIVQRLQAQKRDLKESRGNYSTDHPK